MLCKKCKDAPAIEGKERCSFCTDDTIVGNEKRAVIRYSLDQVHSTLEWAVRNICSPLVTAEYRQVYKDRIADALKELDKIKPNNS